MNRIQELQNLKAFLESNSNSFSHIKSFTKYFLNENVYCDCKSAYLLGRLRAYLEDHKGEIQE